MVSGNAWIQHLWNGDIVNIRYQVDNPEDFKFQKCSEGIPVGSDNFVIPVNAQHPGTALLFIEYMLEPENAAQNVEWIGYPMPYDGGADRGVPGARQGRPRDQRDRRGPRERPAVREPEGRGPARLGRGVDRVQGLVGGRVNENRFATAFLVPGGLWLLLLFVVAARASCWRSRSATPTTSARRSTAGASTTTSASSTPIYLPVLFALGRLRARHRRALPPDRLPGGLLHRRLRRALEERADRAGGAAVLRQLPRAHLRLDRDARRRRARQRRARLGRPLPQHALRGDRRPRLRLPRLHDPADLRLARPHGPVADRGGQGPLRRALADLPPRHPAAHLPGRAGRLGARVPARGRRLRVRLAARRARARSWSAT